MTTALRLCALVFLAGNGFAATDVRVNFTLNTTDAYGAPLRQNRYYFVYRPDNLPKTTPAPMLLVMDGGIAAGNFHRRADQAGFVLVSCAWSGNSTGTPGTVWINDDPRVVGFEDYDYTSEVIQRVKASDNTNDTFIVGLSKGGHMSLAYACERPSTINAAASVDEFMQLTTNIPTAPVPVMVFEGTADTNVAYSMVKDTVDAWRAFNGLLNATPVTTYLSAPLTPGKVTQATWRSDTGGPPVAFVTVIGGTHTYQVPGAQTGHDSTESLWAFFSQFLTSAQDPPKIVSQPVSNVQFSGAPASFWVSATGNSPVSYQWQKNGKDIADATSNWYTVPAADPADDGASFRVVVTNDSGNVSSDAATLTVRAAPAGPAIAIHPADQAVTAGQPVSFTVSATGAGPFTYQWKKNGVNIAGATAATYSIRAAISPDCGASFSVALTNGAGTVISNGATLTVSPATGAPIILTNPARSRVVVGQKASFSVTAWSESPMTYQWQKGTLTSNMADIPGATDSIYTTPVTTLADHLTLLRCVVSNPSGSVTSANEMLFVTAATAKPTDIASAIAAAAQVGAPFQYTIVSSGGSAPIVYTATPLPAGLSVDASSGVISGTPEEVGVTSIMLDVSNSAGDYSRMLTLTVTADPPAISLDAWRAANFGASATDPSIAGDMADPDSDGYTNLEEFMAGTNPLDSGSTPAVRSVADGSLPYGRGSQAGSRNTTIAHLAR